MVEAARARDQRLPIDDRPVRWITSCASAWLTACGLVGKKPSAALNLSRGQFGAVILVIGLHLGKALDSVCLRIIINDRVMVRAE